MSLDVQPPRRPRPRRGPLRRYLETRGLLGVHQAPHVDTRLVTADGARLAGTYLAGPNGPSGDGPRLGGEVAVLLLHGFAANRRKPAYARLADGLARHVPVLALDLRGHGGSSGVSTLGDREVADVVAGIGWLHRFGHPRVVVMGWSMGATAALHAASRGADLDAVVTVSAPAWFRAPAENAATRRLERVWHSPLQRQALRRLLGVSLAPPSAWSDPPHPVEMAATITRPLLVVHGADDGYFPVTDAQALVAAAGGDTQLWIEPAGFGHAEDGITPAFVDALGRAVVEVAATGRYPSRAEVRAD